MKKNTNTIIKSSIFIGSLVAVPKIINDCIFSSNNRKSKNKLKLYNYEWRFGNINYITVGKGKPLLLVHGIGSGNSCHEWDKNIKSLSKRYKVYAIDLLGFGCSDKPNTSYSAYLYTCLINDFIDDVVGTSCYAVGSSTSASFVIGAYNFKPDNFNKIILINPVNKLEYGEHVINLHKQKWLKNLFDLPIYGTSLYNIASSKIYIEWFLSKYAFSDYTNITTDLIEIFYENAHTGGANAKYPLSAFVSNYLYTDIERMLNKVNIPVHIIWGKDNLLNPIENFDDIKRAKKDVTLSVFNNTKLMPHFEKPKSFFKECTSFFG